jgi:3-oxoacyl-[acyl-carrier protein] reductase
MHSTAVITGASRGIGLALARRLLSRDTRVMLCARNEAELTHSTATLQAQFGLDRVRGIPCDVADSDAVRKFAAETLAFFQTAPTVVVNNAGVVLRAPIDAMTESQWDYVMDVNAKGSFLVSQAFLQAMQANKGGRVIFVSSISGTLGSPNASAYCASKWAVIGLMKSLAEEGRAHHIQSMALLPGSVDTEMLKGSGFDPDMSADDVAKALEFLCLDAPDAMTGSAIELFG